ncbi:hypothetical protein APR12_002467 [Nocardia amikacinitolerans]|uniref:hypothetical protein n=1 Tax=Nocardia amikacinitolerans TaxID=756689 RepID=UPI000A078533|nr:hypothetical protein [Nocardia amikacinitolerans]MCP2317127.1 hypothetical protein [Nocardia amikacinitolerans]
MRETAPGTRHSAPWHLWVVGTLFVLLNLGGVYDYVMALSENADYFRSQNYNGEQIQYFTDYPVLPAIFWTIGVWGGLLAAILLFLRTRWALLAALAGLLGQVILDILTFGFRDRWQVLGPRLALFDLGVLLLTAGFVIYCRTLVSRGMMARR